MPQLARTKQRGKPRITIRLPDEEYDFYRRRAQQEGRSISEYVARLLVQGLVSESVKDVEERMRALIAEIPTGAPVRSSPDELFPPDLALSVFTSEALLALLFRDRDVQKLYEAQKAAKDKMRLRREVANG